MFSPVDSVVVDPEIGSDSFLPCGGLMAPLKQRGPTCNCTPMLKSVQGKKHQITKLFLGYLPPACPCPSAVSREFRVISTV
ncbi:hypothetical protein VNO80_27098 [Phaseolus coccineus]|uniref:Uncharacterized protein n=1 Tax=Phaseolus coccineus TaxID=3886 RepID=A0AAN9LG00_PHACN